MKEHRRTGWVLPATSSSTPSPRIGKQHPTRAIRALPTQTSLSRWQGRKPGAVRDHRQPHKPPSIAKRDPTQKCDDGPSRRNRIVHASTTPEPAHAAAATAAMARTTSWPTDVHDAFVPL